MDIKYINILFISFAAIYSLSIVSQEFENPKDKPIKVVDPVYLESKNVNYELITKNKTQQSFLLLKESAVYRYYIDPTATALPDSSKTNALNNTNINIIGKYLYAFSPQEVANFSQLDSLDKNKKIEPVLIDRFKVIIDENNKVMFTDGSFLVKFNSKVNFSEFALKHNLKLTREFPNINLASFEHTDFNTLENKMSQIEMISFVTEVRYNAIDPNIMPE